MIRYKSKIDQHICSIKLSFSYPSLFIEKRLRQFFNQYTPSSSTSTFLPIIKDEQQFKLIRQTILGQPTFQQSQVLIRASTANLDNDQTNEATNQTKNISINMDKNHAKFHKKIIVHYTHEKHFGSFKRDMHHIYDNTFKKQIDQDIKLIVGNRNRRDAKKELIRKRPKQFLLKNKTLKSKFLNAIRVPKTKSTNVFFSLFLI